MSKHHPHADAPMAPTYYNVTLGQNIPYGSGILNCPCSVIFSYPGGSYSQSYPGTVFAWPTQNSIRMSSQYMNIEAAWVGANGGTLTINTAGGNLNYPITGFSKMVLVDAAVILGAIDGAGIGAKVEQAQSA